MFESSHFTPRARMWRVIFRDKSEFRLLKRPHDLTDDLECKALLRKYGRDYEKIVAGIRAETGLSPILRLSPVGAD